MNVFDIIGPVMIGPSSSHTAGAVRLGRVAGKLLGEDPAYCRITFHGSFANTYRGHGTDRAVVGGLLGMEVDDLRIPDSLVIAEKRGITYVFATADLGDVHPNTALIETKGASGKRISILGYSVGGGNILVKQINGVSVEFNCQYFTIVVAHLDKPGIVAAVTGCLADRNINIAYLKLYRNNRGGDAFLVIELDQPVQNEVITKIGNVQHVQSVSVIESE